MFNNTIKHDYSQTIQHRSNIKFRKKSTKTTKNLDTKIPKTNDLTKLNDSRNISQLYSEMYPILYSKLLKSIYFSFNSYKIKTKLINL